MLRILGKREAEYLMGVKRHMAKLYVAKKIQSHYRRRKAFALFWSLKQHKSCVTIQKYTKGFMAHTKSRQFLSYVTLIRRIQLYYKKRMMKFGKGAVIVQKCLK